jgi:hypothetical protein
MQFNVHKAQREFVLLMEAYLERFGEWAPVFIMGDRSQATIMRLIREALALNKPYNPMPGDPGIRSDAIF